MHDIYISYAQEDRQHARILLRTIYGAGFSVWMDKRDVPPDYDWQVEIEKAVRNCRAVLLCLSDNSIKRRGVDQMKVRHALDVLERRQEGDVCLILVRFDDCPIPPDLDYQASFDMFGEDKSPKLTTFLTTRLRKPAGFTDGPDPKFVFADIGLDDVDEYWAELPVTEESNLFDQKIDQGFVLDAAVVEADPIFRIVVRNESDTAISLETLGVRLESAGHAALLGAPPTKPATMSPADPEAADSYALETPNVRDDVIDMGIDPFDKMKEVKLDRNITLKLAEPIRLEAQATYSCALRLKSYQQHTAHCTLIRFVAETDRGPVQSHLICTSSS